MHSIYVWLHILLFIIIVLKERKVLTQSPEYEEIDKPGGKATKGHYIMQ